MSTQLQSQPANIEQPYRRFLSRKWFNPVQHPVRWKSFLGTLLGVILISSVHAADSSLSKEDQEFIQKTAQNGATEVKLGEIGAKKATRKEVRDFGDMLATDHRKMNDDLKALAKKKGVTLSDTLDSKHQKKIDDISSTASDSFDKKYLACLVESHQTNIRKFEKIQKSTQDSDLQHFVAQYLPALNDHEQKARSLQK